MGAQHKIPTQTYFFVNTHSVISHIILLQVVRVMSGEQQLDGANIQDVNVAVDFAGVPSKEKKKSQSDSSKPAAATS